MRRTSKCPGDEQGGIGDFLLGVTLMAFVTFFPLEMAVPLSQMWALNHIKAQLLQVITWEGQVPVDIQTRVERAASGYPHLEPEKIEIGPATTSPGVAVQYGDPITLQLGYPQGRMVTPALVGLDWDPTRMMWVRGTVLSQRPWR